MKPSQTDFFQAAKDTYQAVAPDAIGDFTKIRDTRTFDAYLNTKTKSILIGIRGTADAQDIKADAALALNSLTTTLRYEHDKNVLKQLLIVYPVPEYSYYLGGHSLGGAISTQLKRDFPFLKDSVQFNPAFQPTDLLRSPTDILRYYTRTDFLYRLGGKNLPNVRIIEPTRFTGLSAIDSFTGHKLENFSRVFKSGQLNSGLTNNFKFG